jgi:hypothetical protein
MILDAFTFSILANCDGREIPIAVIQKKLSDHTTSERFVLNSMKDLEEQGMLVFTQGRTHVKCDALGSRNLKATRSARDKKLKRRPL